MPVDTKLQLWYRENSSKLKLNYYNKWKKYKSDNNIKKNFRKNFETQERILLRQKSTLTHSRIRITKYDLSRQLPLQRIYYISDFNKIDV